MATTVFTNGCFDVIHVGHVDFLERASKLGDHLIVGLNSDESVRGIKGPSRPVHDEESRKRVLLSLRSVDEVHIFDEKTPERLIRELSPDVLVKGGDWKESEIVGAEFVRARGGRVESLPLFGGFSTSAILSHLTVPVRDGVSSDEASVAERAITDHLEVLRRMTSESLGAIEACGRAMIACVQGGNKILLCGNGGSAADAQHIAAELVGRFEKERRGLPAIALTTDTSALTAISNDYSFTDVYTRQIEALAVPGDLVVCISTSGNSPNIVSAAMKARELGCGTVGLTGANGKKLAGICDEAVLVPSSRTARIQEAHITIGHIWCEMVDDTYAGA